MLVQLDKNQTGMVEVPISILIGESFADDFFLFSCSKDTDANIANFV